MVLLVFLACCRPLTAALALAVHSRRIDRRETSNNDYDAWLVEEIHIDNTTWQVSSVVWMKQML